MGMVGSWLWTPKKQRVLAASCMSKPEGNEVVVSTLNRITPKYKNVDGAVLDRMCGAVAAIDKEPKLKQLKYCAVDHFHAKKGHGKTCPCNPYYVKRLKKRFSKTNTSAAEQVFSWFRNYARVLNEARPSRHRFKVLYYCRKHNELIDKG